jgi:hypothetical protein
MTIPEVEPKLPKILFLIHEEITKLLKEHKIIGNEDDKQLNHL